MEPSSAKLAAYRRKLSTKRNNKEEGKKPDEKLQTKNCGDEKLCKTRVPRCNQKTETAKCFGKLVFSLVFCSRRFVTVLTQFLTVLLDV
jgi:hypothetical protein